MPKKDATSLPCKRRPGGQLKDPRERLIRRDFRLRLDQIERLAREPNASAVVRAALDAWDAQQEGQAS